MPSSRGLSRLIILSSFLLLSACGSVPKTPEPAIVAPTKPYNAQQAGTVQAVPAPTDVVPVSYLAPTPSSPFECASRLPLEKRIGQLIFPLVTPVDFLKAQQLASIGLVGGVVVLGAPSASIRDAIAIFQKRSLYGPGIVAVDEEGGRVQRLAKLTSRLPSARKVARSMSLDQARRLAADHAADVGDLGFTMNLAPVADIDFGRAIGDRSYGSDADTVSDFALATAEGILDAGLVPVLKHFPGHGRGSDSHFGLPVIPSVDVLREEDLLPFAKISHRSDVPIMVGHLVVEGLTQGLPASLSREAIDGLLRGELGFQGVVMTDAFNMDAISKTLSDAEAAELSIAAGADLVMLSSLSDVIPAVDRVLQAVKAGRISDRSINESFLRTMRMRSIDICQQAAFH